MKQLLCWSGTGSFNSIFYNNLLLSFHAKIGYIFGSCKSQIFNNQIEKIAD